MLDFGILDTSYLDQIDPNLFASAIVYHDETNLKYPEDIAVSDDETIYSGMADGTLVSISKKGELKKLLHHKETGMINGIIITKDNKALYYVTEHKGLVKYNIS